MNKKQGLLILTLMLLPWTGAQADLQQNVQRLNRFMEQMESEWKLHNRLELLKLERDRMEMERSESERLVREQEEKNTNIENEIRRKAENKFRSISDDQQKSISSGNLHRHILEQKRLRYYSLIRDKISRNWRQPIKVGNKPECEVRVVQGPGGIILDVNFGVCPGTREYRLSIEAAVLKSDPLPLPEDESLFEKYIILKFKP